MPKNGRSQQVLVSDLLNRGGVVWPKKAKDWQKAIGDAEVVYEDNHVIAFHDPEDAPHESARAEGEIRVTLLPKQPVATLMDLNVTHEELNARMLYGVQQVAYKLNLQNEGFEVRAHVLPPYQHRAGYALRIRAGKTPTKSMSP
jgi:diadenosine tetraphosphate (Ap4A) HIT family hydrolase